ncbi:MAG: sigma-70 family RNA polymerase sigma factor [Hyphomicrobium sp.]
MDSPNRNDDWDELMRASLGGDDAAYRRLLNSLTPSLRAVTRRGCMRMGAELNDVEDVVQETLLTIHLKRHTWNVGLPIKPWILAIARNKLVDVLRRRGRRIHIPIEDVIETLEALPANYDLDYRDIAGLMKQLGPRDFDVVHSIAVEERPVRDVAERLGMSEGAVRVALHRSLKKLAAIYRRGEIK